MAEKLAVFTLENGLTLVSGLFWQPLVATNAKDARVEAIEVADQMQFDMGIVINGDQAGAGLCSKEAGAEEGAVSVALMISDSLNREGVTKDCLMAIPLGIPGDSRYVYLARRDGRILHDGDLIGSEDEVRAMMHSHYSMADWPVIVCPTFFGFRGATERRLEDFVQKTKKGKVLINPAHRVHLLRTSYSGTLRQHSGKAALVLVLVVAAAFGANYYKVYKAQIVAELAARKAAEAAFTRQMALPPPWHSEASAHAMVESCMSVLNDVQIAPGGWVMESAACNAAGNTIVEWMRPGYSSISMLKSIIPDADISLDGNKATLMKDVAPGKPEIELLKSKSEGIAHVIDQTQRLGLTVIITPEPEVPPVEGAPQKTWSTVQWSISTQFLPQEVVKWLDFPGLRISRIAVTFDGSSVSTYKIDGVLYAKK